MLKNFGGSTIEPNAAIFNNQKPVGEFREQRDFLLDHNNRGAMLLRIALEQGKHVIATSGIKLCSGLIKHQNAGVQRQNGRDGHFLLLPARQSRNRTMPQICNAHIVKRLRNAPFDLRARHREVLQAVQDFIFHHA